MKNIILITVFLFLNFTKLACQSFEGIIEYKIEYKNINPGLNAEEIKNTLGEKTMCFIKDGFYLEKTETEFMGFQLFRAQDSAIYYYNSSSDDTLFIQNTAVTQKHSFEYSITQNADTILGYSCDKIEVEDKYGTISYYFNKSLALNPEYYRNYTLNNKHEIMKIMKSVYLRLEMSYPYFDINIIATRITPKKLKNKIFKLPEEKIRQTINH